MLDIFCPVWRESAAVLDEFVEHYLKQGATRITFWNDDTTPLHTPHRVVSTNGISHDSAAQSEWRSTWWKDAPAFVVVSDADELIEADGERIFANSSQALFGFRPSPIRNLSMNL